MGRITHDAIHFAALLFLVMFIIRWGKDKLDENGSTYKAVTYLFH